MADFRFLIHETHSVAQVLQTLIQSNAWTPKEIRTRTGSSLCREKQEWEETFLPQHFGMI